MVLPLIAIGAIIVAVIASLGLISPLLGLDLIGGGTNALIRVVAAVLGTYLFYKVEQIVIPTITDKKAQINGGLLAAFIGIGIVFYYYAIFGKVAFSVAGQSSYIPQFDFLTLIGGVLIGAFAVMIIENFVTKRKFKIGW